MADFLLTMYGDGNACIGNKYGKTVVKAKDIYFNNDGHMTVNFLKWGGGRTTDNLSCLNALKFDLDTEKVGLSPYGAFQLLDDEIFGKNRLPYPTFVVNSGAGLHIYYKFDNVIRTDALDVYKRLEKTFCEYFKDYGIDTAASVNPVGVLRLPGTVNEKHGNTVRVIYENSKNIYSFRDLCDEYLSYSDNEAVTEKQLVVLSNMERVFGVKFPDNYKANKRNARKTIKNNLKRYMAYNPVKPVSEKQLKYIDKICKAIDKECPNIVSSYEANVWIKEHEELYKISADKYGLHNKDMDLLRSKGSNSSKDIKILKVLLEFIESNRENSYKRETLLFYIRYIASLIYDRNMGISIMLQANSQLSEPFTEKKIITLTNSVNNYLSKNKKLHIGIKSISYRVTGRYEAFDCYAKKFKENKKAVDRKTYQHEYQKKRYQNKLAESGKTTKSDKIANRRAIIEELLNKGLSAKEIAEQICVGMGTVYNDISYINKNKETKIGKSVIEEEPKYLENKEVEDFSKNSNTNILNIFDVPMVRIKPICPHRNNSPKIRITWVKRNRLSKNKL